MGADDESEAAAVISPELELADDVDQVLAERPYLRRLALSMARHADDADDLVQETLLRALRARSQFQPGTCMRAWLTTILRHAFLGSLQIRNRRRTQPWTDAGVTTEMLRPTPAGQLAVDPSTETCDLQSVEEHLDDRLRRALRQLPSVYREPLVLFALGELSYREIAERLGIPEGTVMSRIFRARARVRCALGADEPASRRSRRAS